MFKIIEERQNDLDRLKLLNQDTGEYVSIIPRFGSNINELVLNKQGNLHSIIDGNLDKVSFAGNGVFKSANMLPFANRVKNGCFTFRGRQYQLPKNSNDDGNAVHGFIYDKLFRIKDQTVSEIETQITLEYESDSQIAGYPFPLKIKYIYTLNRETGFKCKTTVENLAETAIPFGCGWHPYFNLNNKIDELKLMFSAQEHILVDTALIPNGLTEKYTRFNTMKSIGAQSFDACFKIDGSSNLHTTKLYNEVENLEIVLWQETGDAKYNYLQLYIPPSRESIAIEPMTSNVNAFNNQQGLIVLKSRQKFAASYGVQLK